MENSQRSSLMSRIRSKNNKTTEWRVRSLLMHNRLKGWKMHVKWLPGCPDFVFEKEKVAIFIDGCFWHGCPLCYKKPKTSIEYWEQKLIANKNRDDKVNKLLEINGWFVLRFWEHETREKSMIMDKIINSLNLAISKNA